MTELPARLLQAVDNAAIRLNVRDYIVDGRKIITEALREAWREEVEAAEEALYIELQSAIRNHFLVMPESKFTAVELLENTFMLCQRKSTSLAAHDTALVERTRQEAASVIDAWVRSHEFAGEGPCTEDCFEYSCSDLKRIATEIRALAEKAGGSL